MTLRQQVTRELDSFADSKLKTARMFRLELQHRQDIKALIAPQQGELASERATLLGIGEATLSEWRTLFKIKNVRVFQPGPVPKCSRCSKPTRQENSIKTETGPICPACVSALVERVDA
jgi:formylmethanofuran dehydrogenase subunit E